MKPKEAYEEVQAQGAEWIQEGRRLLVYEPRIWSVRGFNLQMIPGVIQGRAGSFRYPVGACGAHSRRLAPGRSMQLSPA